MNISLNMLSHSLFSARNKLSATCVRFVSLSLRDNVHMTCPVELFFFARQDRARVCECSPVIYDVYMISSKTTSKLIVIFPRDECGRCCTPSPGMYVPVTTWVARDII